MSHSRGWRRRGSRGRFRYVDRRGEPIVDPAALERIRALAIPPAWREVTVSPSPRARVQATGLDAAGRRQYVYNPAFRAAREEEKYGRLLGFGERLPLLRAALAADIAAEPLTPDWTCAVATRLVNETWFRVGSERYVERSRTYGVTTLRKRHVEVRGSTVRFCFRAKHRVLVRTSLVDGELALALRRLSAQPGSRLFRYLVDDRMVDLTGETLNTYIRLHLGERYSAKDFRTWGGTLIAAIALAEHGPPTSDTDARRAIAAACRRAGEALGNSAAVARSSYVSPAVLERFQTGVTLGTVRPRRLRVIGARDAGLSPEEDALLTLLRSHRQVRARAA